VLAAVERFRADTDAYARVTRCRPTDASLVRYRGRCGRMIIAKTMYRGFEPFDRLLYVAVLEPAQPGGAFETVPADLAEALVRGPIESIDALPQPSQELEDALEDALDETVFDDQLEAGDREQARFRAALDQLDRYMEDQLLLMRRDLEGIAARIETAQQARDAALGADARSRAEKQLRELEKASDETIGRIGRFETRDDEEYRRWRAAAQKRRAEPPAVIRLAEFPFEVE